MRGKAGTTALITGGGRGLGRAFALALAREAMRIAVAARTETELDETVRMIRGEGGTAIAVAADVTSESDVERMVRAVESQLGPIDVLVNNAGSGGPFGPTWEAHAEEWWRTVEVNLKGPVLCARAVLPGMIERGLGRIVNIASGAGTISIPYMSSYVTSKTALIRFSEVLADEVRPHGIAVFAIQPGTVRTAMAEKLLESEDGEKWLPWFRKIFEEGRDDSTEPGTRLVAYLASGKADQLSGRFFMAPRAPEDVVSRAQDVIDNELHVLRMRHVS